MELTPKVFRDVQFREKLRGGYHPEDVDEFLEQAAVACEGIQAQLRQALERAQRAEQAATDASSTDESLRKMLVLAQRTADQAVAEAKFEADRVQNEARQEADRLLGEARSEAERVLTDSRIRSAGLLNDAEEQARRAYEQGLAESRENMARAEEALRQAQQEVEVLRNWVDMHRSHLLSVLREAQSLVEGTGLLSEPPATSTQPAGTVEASGQDAPAADGPAVAREGEPDPLNRSEETTGEWDPQYMHSLGNGPDAATPGSATNGRDTSGSYGAEHDVMPGDATMAFDERALDNFFTDQDIGEARGLGRFRRRQ